MRILTIGFTKKSAETFFTLLKEHRVRRLVDVRLNNVSQLAGFAKKDDLRYFTKAICGIDYVHIPELAPTAGILDRYRKQKKADWQTYETQFVGLIRKRQIEQTVPRELLDGGCLLCSEDTPQHCHRRLVAEYLEKHWGNVEIEHIL
ncbi:MAG TPA: DUF488 domain-containing protein [Bryobacteraceae bacterium]|jgi:uncharacterized protein (DUF488 family)|nr:DUF488 domain-containing protein [Bryobacteraceae bacterium]